MKFQKSKFFWVKNGILHVTPPQVFVTIYICEDKPDTFIIYAQKYCFHTFIMQKEKLNKWYPSFPFLFEIFFMENFRCD